MTTKIHALSDLSCTPVMALLTPGQAGDNPMLGPLVDAAIEAGYGRDFRLLADKAYSHPSTRNYLRDKRIKHTIPQRSDQIAQRTSKGSKGGRPPSFDTQAYVLRNTVERVSMSPRSGPPVDWGYGFEAGGLHREGQGPRRRRA